jgi:hypothetical protein
MVLLGLFFRLILRRNQEIISVKIWFEEVSLNEKLQFIL